MINNNNNKKLRQASSRRRPMVAHCAVQERVTKI